jgi:hypothetical protein
MNLPLKGYVPRVKCQMSELIHWITVAGCFGLVAFGLVGFFRGLALPANDHRAPGKGDSWYT